MDGISLPMSYEYSKFLFYSSFSMLIATIISYIMNDIYITSYFLIMFLTSINYWRRPEYGLRRNIDLFMVKFGLCAVLWQVCLLKSEFTRYCLVYLFICCVFFYIIEHILCYMKSVKWIIFHMAIHMYFSSGALMVVLD
jgi:hypothetical protein